MQLVIWLGIRLMTKLQKSQKLHNRIIQNQLQMNMIKKYLKGDICIYRRKTENHW